MRYLLLILQQIIQYQLVRSQCHRDSYGRGAGVPTSDCLTSEEREGSICYPKCRDGYKGIGPVCWETCQSPFDDTGAFCMKPAVSYTKSCCCVNLFGKKKCCNNCKSGYKDTGCTCFSQAITRVNNIL